VDLDRRGWVIVDHWDADRFAIGLARAGRDDLLAYVSTWGKPSGRFFVELETPDAVQPLGYSATRHDDVDLAEAMLVIERHLTATGPLGD
jgi:hypothetical protein